MTQSNVKWVKIENLIEVKDKKNSEGRDLPVYGINKDKSFMPTVANLEGVDLRKYKVLKKGWFVFSGMQTGRDVCIRIGMFEEEQDVLMSPAYTTFVVKEDCGMLPEYFFIYFNRSESDRFGWFISDSSVRANLDWPRFLDIELPLPSIEHQREIVETWQGLRKMKEDNEQIAAPLMQLCQSYIQDLKKKYPLVEIGPYIIPSDETNSSGDDLPILGLNKDKVFMPTAANTSSVDIKKYKLVKKGRFAFSGMQTGRDVCIRLSLYDKDEPAIISPAYSTFEIDDTKGLLSEYMYLMFTRPEMDRLGWFYSDSSVRSNLDWPRFIAIKIPLPPVEIQKAIVDIYKCAKEATRIAQEADQLSRDICPALMQHCIHTN